MIPTKSYLESFKPLMWIASIGAAATAVAMVSLLSPSEPSLLSPSESPPSVASVVQVLPDAPEQALVDTDIAWRLNNPVPVPMTIFVGPENPATVDDMIAARARSMDQRASLRAFDGAPPVIPHTTAGLNIQSCLACHRHGIQAGEMVARMMSHTYLANCTQCHVEAASPLIGIDQVPVNTFIGLRSRGCGTRAWAGAPPVIPHTTFMRTNCVSCHGEHGYDGCRPDHLSRSNCLQCHAPAAQFDQLAPTFNILAVPDGAVAEPPR